MKVARSALLVPLALWERAGVRGTAMASSAFNASGWRWSPWPLRSYRIGRFRIIYRISPEREIEIVAVGPRSHIYQETYRLLRRRNECQ